MRGVLAALVLRSTAARDAGEIVPETDEVLRGRENRRVRRRCRSMESSGRYLVPDTADVDTFRSRLNRHSESAFPTPQGLQLTSVPACSSIIHRRVSLMCWRLSCSIFVPVLQLVRWALGLL